MRGWLYISVRCGGFLATLKISPETYRERGGAQMR